MEIDLMSARKVRDRQGNMVDAPADLRILALEDRGVRLSRDGMMSLLRVTYGLQTTDFSRTVWGDDLVTAALEEFDTCVQHAKSCEMID
jgi:hypothetical protein